VYFVGKYLDISIEPTDVNNEILVTIARSKNSKVTDTSGGNAGELKLYLIFMDSIRTILHTVYNQRATHGFPIKFKTTLPAGLDYEYVSYDFWVKWYY
jgi:hypothetical protein